MRTKHIATSALIAALVAAPMARAMADAADGLVGGLVGGIVGGVIVNEAAKNRERQRSVVVRQAPRVSSATRAANREVQTSLNYFGFNAGPVDGVIGRGTRSAIAGYQAHLGYPATGELTPYERDFLITSYQRAIAGGPTTAQMIATNPQGSKGLLTMFRNQALGLQPQGAVPAYGQQGVVAAAPAPQVQQAPVPQVQQAPTFAAAAPGTSLPTFQLQPEAPVARSLASHCGEVSLVTGTNGFITASTMTDPSRALEEQFCLARAYTMDDGEKLAGRVAGVSREQIEAQCRSLAPALETQVTAVSQKPAPDVVASVASFVEASGQEPAQLAGTSKICLSVGYRTDNMPVALASALLLTGLGQQPYAELLGHHLSQGFGALERPDLARQWYAMAIEAVEGGAAQVINPGQPERVALLRKAALGDDGTAAPTAASATPTGNLPVFKLEP